MHSNTNKLIFSIFLNIFTLLILAKSFSFHITNIIILSYLDHLSDMFELWYLKN